MAASLAATAISIDPSVRFQLSSFNRGLRLQGGFNPGGSYRIKLAGSITSKNGWKIGHPLVRQLHFPHRQPLLRLADSGQILSMRGNKILTVESVNLAALELTLYRIYRGQSGASIPPWAYMSTRRAGSAILWCGVNSRSRHPRIAWPPPPSTCRDLVAPHPAIGAYLLCLRGIDHHGDTYDRDSRLLLVTDLGLTLKQIPGGELLCWVTSLADAVRPVSGAQVTLWSVKNNRLAQATTDAWGIAHLHFADSDRQVPFMLEASKGSDLAFLKLGSGAWNLEKFAGTGKPTCRNEYQAFIYSDRGAYRPGEQVHLAALIRDRYRQVPSAFPLLWSIHRNDGVEVHRAIVSSGPSGSCEISWPAPADLRTGIYHAQLRLPGAKDYLGSYRFHVEDFVPDRFQLKLAGDRRQYHSGQRARLTFSGKHLHGAPASGRRLQIRVHLGAQPFQAKKYSQYQFNDTSRTCKDFQLIKTEKLLDAAGQAELLLKIPKIKSASGLKMVVEATLHEHGGRATTRRREFTVHNHCGYLGICGNFDQVPRPGRCLEFAVVAIDPELKPLPLPPQVQVRVVRYDWVWNISGSGADARYRYLRREQVVERNWLALSRGQAKYRFTPHQYGEYRLFITDPGSGMASSMKFSTWGGSAVRQPGAEEYLQLQCDCRDYPIGATAKINLRSPLSGMALVCLERERVFAWEVVPVINGSAEVSFAITPEYLPNVYCSATVIRPVAWQKERQPHRVYGICPIMVQSSSRQLQLDIAAVATTLPASKVEVTVTVAQGKQKIAGAAVTLAAVDEGVCQVTDFHTPDPYAFFYGKESLQSRSCDSYQQLLPEAAAGDANRLARSSTQPKRPRRFRILAIWRSGQHTDVNGMARFHLELPKYLGQVRLMAIAAHRDCFGSQQRPLRVASPAILEVAAPRFAAWGDRFTVTANIINHSGQRAQAHLQAKTGPQLEPVGPMDQSIAIAANGEGKLSFSWRCCNGEQTQLRFQGTLGAHRLSETIELPLRPAAPQIDKYGYGTVAAGKSAVVRLAAPAAGDDDQVLLTLASRPEMHLSSRLRYLLRYPYGCVEQTTSRAFPLLHFSQLLKLAQESTPGAPAQAADYVRAAISRLALMQTGSGGLSMWPGGIETYPWGSCYAGHFLEEARQAGYLVPPDLRSRVLNYLKKLAHAGGYSRERRGLRAYAAYVLALAGQIKYSDIAYLVENKKTEGSAALLKTNASIAGDERCFLAATLAALGQRHRARELLHRPSMPTQAQTGGNLNSPLRDDAILLATLVAIDPEDDQVRRLVATLTASCRDGYGHNTQESAWILLALGKYLASFGTGIAGELQAKVQATGQKQHVLSSGKQAHLRLSRPQALAITIANSSSGPLFYRWMIRELATASEKRDAAIAHQTTGQKQVVVSTADSVPPRVLRVRKVVGTEAPLRLAIRFLDNAGKPITAPWSVRQGDMIWAEIQVQGRQGYRNLVVESLLASGFEPENPRLANSARWKPHQKSAARLKADYIDIHDDRIEFFVDLPDSDRYCLYYGIRAVTPGVFQWPAIRAWCMYVPQIAAHSYAGRIEVRQP